MYLFTQTSTQASQRLCHTQNSLVAITLGNDELLSRFSTMFNVQVKNGMALMAMLVVDAL